MCALGTLGRRPTACLRRACVQVEPGLPTSRAVLAMMGASSPLQGGRWCLDPAICNKQQATSIKQRASSNMQHGSHPHCHSLACPPCVPPMPIECDVTAQNGEWTAPPRLWVATGSYVVGSWEPKWAGYPCLVQWPLWLVDARCKSCQMSPNPVVLSQIISSHLVRGRESPYSARSRSSRGPQLERGRRKKKFQGKTRKGKRQGRRRRHEGVGDQSIMFADAGGLFPLIFPSIFAILIFLFFFTLSRRSR